MSAESYEEYWFGYEQCKEFIDECGLDCAIAELEYGLDASTLSFRGGWYRCVKHYAKEEGVDYD